jgi:hypothetical protein
MAFHDLPDTSQPGARARELTRLMQPLKRQEELVHVHGVEADAIVAHVAAHAGLRGRPRPELDRGTVPVRGEFPGISQEVSQHHTDKSVIPQHPGWLLDGKTHASAGVLTLQVPGDAGDLGTEINLLQTDLRPGHLGQVQQAVENVADMLAGELDLLGVGASALPEGVPALFRQREAEAGQRAQRGTQLVR